MLANASISYSSSRFADIHWRAPDSGVARRARRTFSRRRHAPCALVPLADDLQTPAHRVAVLPTAATIPWWWPAMAIAYSSKASGSRFRPQSCRIVATIPPGTT